MANTTIRKILDLPGLRNYLVKFDGAGQLDLSLVWSPVQAEAIGQPQLPYIFSWLNWDSTQMRRSFRTLADARCFIAKGQR